MKDKQPQLTKFKEAAKKLTLKSATTSKKRRQFMAEHPEPTDEARFNATLASMVGKSPEARKASDKGGAGN